MTFEAATNRMFAAIHARDLEQLGRALRARASAIKAGVTPTLAMIEDGERALRALADLKKGLAWESSRLRQLQTGVISSLAPRPRPRVDYRG
jgi:hypothetical protein